MQILAVIPSYATTDTQLRNLVAALTPEVHQVLVVANSKQVQTLCKENAIPALYPGENLGFGRAVNLAASTAADWSHLWVVNDDIALDGAGASGHIAEAVLNDTKVGSFSILGSERARTIPGLIGVFANVSTLSRYAQLERSRNISRPYFSFSCVLISRSLWHEVGGLDDTIPFTFEDADFTRRAALLGVRPKMIETGSVIHQRSRTSRSRPERVVPLVAWSAWQYLRLRHPHTPVQLLKYWVLLALVLRIPLSVAGWRTARKNLLGVFRAFRALLTVTEPPFPNFDAQT